MTALVTWIWQGLAIAAVAALLVRAVPRSNAATRHAVWWCALAMVLIQPWWTPITATVDLVAGAAGDSVDAPNITGVLRVHALPGWLIVAAAALWGGMAGFRFWRIGRSVWLMRRIREHAYRLDNSRQARLCMWRSVRNTGRAPELCASNAVTSACALGVGRPMIVIPEILAATLPDPDLDMVVMHEHAHLARYDDWLRLLQCLIHSIAGLHPAVWFISGRIDFEREAACDDHVVLRAGDPHRYARCLTDIAGLAAIEQPQTLISAPAIIRSATGLRARVARLLNIRSLRSVHVRWWNAMAGFTVLASAVVALDRMPPFLVVDGLQENLRPRPAPMVRATPSGQDAVAVRPSALEGAAQRRPVQRRLSRSNAGLPAAQHPVAPVETPIPTADDLPAPIPLASRVWPPLAHSPPVALTVATTGPENGFERGLEWGRFIDAGAVAGDSARRAGTTVASRARQGASAAGSVFSTARRAVARSF